MRSRLLALALGLAVVVGVAGLSRSAWAQSTYTVTDLGTLGGSYSLGFGINNSGQVTGQSSTTGDAADHAFLISPPLFEHGGSRHPGR